MYEESRGTVFKEHKGSGAEENTPLGNFMSLRLLEYRQTGRKIRYEQTQELLQSFNTLRTLNGG